MNIFKHCKAIVVIGRGQHQDGSSIVSEHDNFVENIHFMCWRYSHNDYSNPYRCAHV